ncbi:MAG TPA: glycine oxidase ThiO [Gemmatimonadales bacterium]|nr:glycine oxidase ThiO [Gemmatimonadales bacterium]
MKALDVAVIGGGVVGAACARAAALRGLEVAIFEPGPDPAAASPASAGMLAAQIEPGDEALLALSVRARDLYEEIAHQLHETTGIDIGFWRAGIASIAFDEAAADRLTQDVARQRQAGLRCDWLDGDEVRERWPGASPDCHGALFSPEDGAVDPQALTRACLADARRVGATLRVERVTAVQTAQGRVTGVVTPDGTTAVGHVVLAAGVWSSQIAGLPRPLPIEPVRGQLAATAWPPGTPAAILYHDHGYVLARGAEAVLGSTMERAGFECRVTNEGLAQIFRGAVRLLPTLYQQAVRRMWAGLRPVTADGWPIIGPDPAVQHLCYAAGHGRSGVLLAALTADIIADLLTQAETDVDITPLRVDRFVPPADG